MFVNNYISFKYLRSFHLPRDTQGIRFEINLKQRKLLVASIYRTLDQNLDYFWSSIIGLLDHCFKSHGDCIIVSDFKVNESNPAKENFLNQRKCKNIITSKTCYKSQEDSCTDLIITVGHSLHHVSQVFETGISIITLWFIP